MTAGAANDRTDQHPATPPERRRTDRSERAILRFITEASHALRNPLHGVLGLSEMLIEADLEGPLADAAWAIFRQAAQMRTVVDDMVDIARIETGHLRVHLTPVDVAHALHDCLYVARERAPHGVLITSDEVPPDAARVQADHDRLRQVLGNLIDNACYAAGTSVHVMVRLGDRDGTVRFEVTDDGPGFDALDLARLFEPYERGPAADPDGAGLGLAIARGAVVAMDGAIDAHPGPDGGATFWFELPRAVGPVVEPSPSAGIPGRRASYSGIRVLVVEDDPVNRMLAAMQLERLGTVVTAAPTGEDAWDALQCSQFDVAFIDVQMPGISGLELVGRMAALGEHRPVTAIMTASATAADRTAALEAGADHFVPKPATLVDVRSVLDFHSRRRTPAGIG